MKKTYIAPSLLVAYIGTAKMVCSSQDVTSGGDVDDINYGGVDEEGEKDPESRRYRNANVWEDEELEEEAY